MRTKAHAYKSLQQKDPVVFSSIDNNVANKRIFKSITTNKEEAEKENVVNNRFISCSYDTITTKQIYQKRPFYKHISQTFTTDVNHDRVLPTTERPTMGGKTVSSIPVTPQQQRMSTEELKSLSRRIDPHEPLSSPHASPTKPPLPTITSNNNNNLKRKRQNQLNTTKKAQHEFTCKPCHKKYKTRNGYSYHIERCQFRNRIQCICKEPTKDVGTLMECITCDTWLHSTCIGIVSDESQYCCPKCQQEPEEEEEEHVLQNGRTIKLSELCQAKERGKNLLQSFKETEYQVTEKPIRNEFNFISLFSDDTVLNQSPVLHSNAYPVEEEEEEEEEEEQDFSSCLTNSDWNTDPPSLLFSDNDLPSSDLSINQADWLHFANFEVDFHIGQDEDEL